MYPAPLRPIKIGPNEYPKSWSLGSARVNGQVWLTRNKREEIVFLRPMGNFEYTFHASALSGRALVKHETPEDYVRFAKDAIEIVEANAAADLAT
jgi:hypothetical protein